MSTVDSLEELLQDELKDIYDAEKQLTKALPKMVKNATAGELKQAFQDHLGQTEQHVKRLEDVFEQRQADDRVDSGSTQGNPSRIGNEVETGSRNEVHTEVVSPGELGTKG